MINFLFLIIFVILNNMYMYSHYAYFYKFIILNSMSLIHITISSSSILKFHMESQINLLSSHILYENFQLKILKMHAFLSNQLKFVL